MHRVKLGIAGALVLALALFVAQNTEVVDVRFLVWKVEMSRALLVPGVLAVGFALGWLVSSFGGSRR